jgi:BirA family biotin operon repressor/biotin-[acetyl-CoA-carboxylase] ligase
MIGNEVLDECDSTNRVARELALNGAVHGTWVSSRIQTQGRGRLSRKWESAEGNLFLSIVVRDVDVRLWSWVPLATAVGVQRGLARIFPEVPIRIKWPNDLCISVGMEQAKLGGILCEGTRDFVVVGIGLNCRAVPQGLGRRVISLSEVLGPRIGSGIEIDADQVRLPFKDSALEALDELGRWGSDSILKVYESVAVLRRGLHVGWNTKDSGASGWVEGLGAHGDLVVRLPSGETKSLFADEVQVLI